MAPFGVFPKLPGIRHPPEGRDEAGEKVSTVVQELLSKDPSERVSLSWNFCLLDHFS